MKPGCALVCVLAPLLLLGCESGGGTPDPQEPSEPYENPLLEGGDTPPNTSMDKQSGLIIDSNRPTEVMVDGKKVGKTPITVENLTAGEHEVVFLDSDEGNVTMTVDLGEAEYKRVHHAHAPDASDARMGGTKKKEKD
jgi:hypothetical protein